MGDRVLFQVVSRPKNKKPDFSPAIYGHWSGNKANEVCARLKVRMKGIGQDVSYTAARLVQELIGEDKSSASFGIWNEDHVLTEEDTHDDGGVILVDVSDDDMKFECFGGYWKVSPTGDIVLK